MACNLTVGPSGYLDYLYDHNIYQLIQLNIEYFVVEIYHGDTLKSPICLKSLTPCIGIIVVVINLLPMVFVLW